MNCREFRRQHDRYLDDTLNGRDLDAMEGHRAGCERCSQLDTRVRRALLVAHNLPTIQPSAAFGPRLQARLLHERAAMSAHGSLRDGMPGSGWRPMSGRAFTALAAAILVIAGTAASFSMIGRERDVIRLMPVIASRPESDPGVLATPAMVASMPAGMTIWPAVFAAQQAPWHFASDAVGEERK